MKVFQMVASMDSLNLKGIEIDSLPILETKENSHFKREVYEAIGLYNALLKERDEKQNILNSIDDDTFTYFSPLLLVIGLALRLAKVTGELKHEKKQPKS